MARIGAVILLFVALAGRQDQGLFTEAERAKVIAYWNVPGRYKIDAPSMPGTSWPWAVRLTPEASVWFWNYNRARGFGKVPPTQVPGAGDPRWAAWERWIEAKLAYDRWNSAIAARHNADGSEVVGAPPPHPGPAPADLIAAAGNPPEFAAAIAPLNYVITFDTGEKITYTDHPDVPARYAYYRFGHGVRYFGTPLRSIPDAELDAAFSAAGMSGFERRVARAVSVLEGGFESINTYDTGFLSVGFLQFATLEPGSGSLGGVLQRQKEMNPTAFESDFRRFGIDVNPAAAIVVVDPGTGAELVGNAAVRKIIDDKRLTAVFQRAGSRSSAFRAAQIRVMRDRYYPAYDPITIVLDGRTISGRVLDAVKSEAGIATLFDRKVNRGNIEPLPTVIAGVISKYRLNSLPEAAAYEREIVGALKYRHDFLADSSLSQPPALPAPKIITESAATDAKPAPDKPEPDARPAPRTGPVAPAPPAKKHEPPIKAAPPVIPAKPVNVPGIPEIAPKPAPAEDAPRSDAPSPASPAPDPAPAPKPTENPAIAPRN